MIIKSVKNIAGNLLFECINNKWQLLSLWYDHEDNKTNGNVQHLKIRPIQIQT